MTVGGNPIHQLSLSSALDQKVSNSFWRALPQSLPRSPKGRRVNNPRVKKLHRLALVLHRASISLCTTSSKRVRHPSPTPVFRATNQLITLAYNIVIKDPQLPVVNVSSPQNPVYLPPQVCIVVPGQPSNAKLSPSQTQQMIRFAVHRPTHNIESIVTDGARMLGFDPTNSTLVSS